MAKLCQGYVFTMRCEFHQESGILYLDKQQQIANNSIIQKKECIPLSKESW